MPLYERYELLELRRDDDGIQTFHARDRETARPVQIHLFPENPSEAAAAENRTLLARIEYLPDAERRRIIERGDYKGRPYVVTDRLAGYAGFREWLMVKTDPAARHATLDDQFHQLFDPYAETAALTAFSSPIAAPPAPVSYVPQEDEAETVALEMAAEPARTQPGIRVVGKSLLGILLGIAAAILLLGLIVAGLAFLPR